MGTEARLVLAAQVGRERGKILGARQSCRALGNAFPLLGSCKTHEVQQGQMQGPVHGSEQSQAEIQSGWRMD